MVKHSKSNSQCMEDYDNLAPLRVALQHFNCLACLLEDGKKLTPHLRKAEAYRCKQQICHFFAITEKNQDRALNLIAQKIRIARKSLHPTRTISARQIETRRRSLISKGPLPFLKGLAKRCPYGRYEYGLLCYHCKSAAYNPKPAQLFKPSISLVNGLRMITPFKGNIQSSSFTRVLVRLTHLIHHPYLIVLLSTINQVKWTETCILEFIRSHMYENKRNSSIVAIPLFTMEQLQTHTGEK